MAEALRGGIVCVVPVVLAVVLHQPLFCWSAIAAFWTCLADDSNASRGRRFAHGLSFGILGGLASACAIAARDVPILAILLTGCVVYAAAIMRSRGAMPGLRTLLLATTFAVSAVFPLQGAVVALHYAGYFLAGGVWAAVCGAGLWQFSGERRVKKAAAIYFSDLAAFVERLAATLNGQPARSGPGRARLRARLDAVDATIAQIYPHHADAPRHVVALRAAADRMMSLLAGLESLLVHDRSPRVRRESAQVIVRVLKRLAIVLDEKAEVIHGFHEEDRPASSGNRAWARQREIFVQDVRLCREHLERLNALQGREWGLACLEVIQQAATVIDNYPGAGPIRGATGATPPPAAARLAEQGDWRFADLRAHMNLRSPWGRHAARMAVGAIIAVAFVMHFSPQQGYWLVLTAMFIMQPGFARTLQVSGQRIGGTVLGAVLASALGLITHNHILLALAIFPLATATLASRAVNYLSFTLFLTPHFILVAQLEVTSAEPWALALSRVVNSIGGVMLGASIALLLWPDWEKHSLETTVKDTLKKCVAYIESVMDAGHDGDRPDGWPAAESRRTACLAIDGLESLLVRMRLEPFVHPERTARAWVCVAELRKLTGVVSLLEGMDATMADTDRAELAKLCQWVRTLSARPAEDATGYWPDRFGMETGGSFIVRYVVKNVAAGVLLVAAVSAGLD
jgi:uncharacterized membrane protein YccC